MYDTSNLLAHYDGKNEKEQLLIDHLSNTAKIASRMGKSIGISNLWSTKIGRASCRERV